MVPAGGSPIRYQENHRRYYKVLLHRSPLHCPYEGPYKVVSTGAKTFNVDRGGKIETVSVDRLKAAHVDFETPPQLHVPRARGRPRNQPVEAPQPTRTGRRSARLRKKQA